MQPLVSICCLAYNQESLIVQAIEGFLMQKTDFPFEIIIHDDASTDNTPIIIRHYAEKYPKLFVPVFQKENQYSKRLMSYLCSLVFSMAKGKYIAICEGDDYWTDPLKLQKQVGFLEANPDYGMVYTNALVYDQESGINSKNGIVNRKYKSFEELLIYSNIPSLTVLIRKEIVTVYENEIHPRDKKWPMADYPLWLFTAKQSKIKYLDEITAVYRVLRESGSHSSSPQKNFAFLLSTFEIRMLFALKYNVIKQIIYSIMNDYYKNTIYFTIQNNDFVYVEECSKFLREQHMNFEFWGVRLMILFKKLNIPLFILGRIVFTFWRDYYYLRICKNKDLNKQQNSE